MPLVKPSLANVSAGQPVTAQAWNKIQDAIGALFDAMLALGSNTVDVNVTDGTAPIAGATVIAVPASGAPIEAVGPRGSSTAYTLTQLTAGSWTLYVSAPGYTAVSQAVTIPAAGPVTITLATSTKVMPDLLGLTAAAAVGTLNTAGIQIDLILDVTGGEVSKTAIPTNRTGSRVLFQFPDPGARVTPASAKTRIVLSAEQEQQITTMPSLVGMSYAQLVKALTDAGLKLGNINYLTK